MMVRSMRWRVLSTSTVAATAVAGCVVSFEDYPVVDPGSDSGTTGGAGGSTGGSGGSSGGVGGAGAAGATGGGAGTTGGTAGTTGGAAGTTGGAGGSTGGAGGSTGGAGGSTGGSGGNTGGAGGVPACTSCSQHETCVNGICFAGVYEGPCGGGGCLSGFTAVGFLVDSANCCNMGAPPLCVRDGTAYTLQDCEPNPVCEAGKKIGLEVASCSCAHSSYVCIDEISS